MRAGFRTDARSQQGVALVITLLMLVLITVMAVAFLLLSQRETASVGALHSTTDAELAADAALERSKALILQPFLVGPNFGVELMGTDLVVSAISPFINPIYTNRLDPGNLQGFVSPPVFVNTNRSGVWDPNLPLEDRFYLDLNENARFEETGEIFDLDGAGNRIPDGNGGDRRAAVIGDPQWFGLLQHPSRAHASDNRYISRYSYLIQPIGRSLDVNSIHNDARDGLTANAAGYSRNQGVGSFENNLAAFLSDLNTNLWSPTAGGGVYYYNTNTAPPGASLGFAFDDALSFLRYRYATNKDNLFRPLGLFPANVAEFETDLIDNFGNGLGFTTAGLEDNLPDSKDSLARPWPGAGNPRSFSSIRDFLNTDKLPPPGFVGRLRAASGGVSTYDRYTYYRMLAQLGVEAVPEKEDEEPLRKKINLNYINVGGVSASQFVPWTRTDLSLVTGWTNGFLTRFGNPINPAATTGPELWMNVAIQRMLREEGKVNSWFTNYVNDRDLPGESPLLIPVYKYTNAVANGTASYFDTNSGRTLPLYSPRIHQIVQMAANIIEGTVTRKANGVDSFPYNPLVFRPVFELRRDFQGPNNAGVYGSLGVYITRYEQVGDDVGANLRVELGLPTTNGVFASTPPTYVWNDLSNAMTWPVTASQNPLLVPPYPTFGNANFYDIPWIFGARKEIPNFNELSMQNVVLFKRFLQVEKIRGQTNLTDMLVRQALLVSVTNYQITELWHPYTNQYPRTLVGYVTNRMTVGLLKSNAFTSGNWAAAGLALPAVPPFSTNYKPTVMGVWPTAGWSGSGDVSTNNRLNLDYEISTLRPSIVDSLLGIIPLTDPLKFDNSLSELRTHWRVMVTNQYRYHLFDYGYPNSPPSNPVLLDTFTSAKVNLDLLVNPALDLEIINPNYQMWDTRTSPTNSVWTRGVEHQLAVASGVISINSMDEWLNFAGFDQAEFATRDANIRNFVDWITNPSPASLTYEVKFNPARRVVQAASWQANDPLVHYTIEDLYSNVASNRWRSGEAKDPHNNTTVQLVKGTLGKVNASYYQPWGIGSDSKFQLNERDPLLPVFRPDQPVWYGPDAWDFPSQFVAGKYPNAGWLGRVHRGTPWQSVYFKSGNGDHPQRSANPAFASNPWWQHTGEAFMFQTYPTNDWRLLDVFTTAIHPNVTRGRLSINQTNLAAWSAVLGGIRVSTTLDADPDQPIKPSDTVIEPYGVESAVNGANGVPLGINAGVLQIAQRVNDARVNFPAGQFHHLSDLLSLDALTLGSPYLNPPHIADAAQNAKGTPLFQLTDADFERIPRQIAGLVKVGEPRFVVYAWGQSLKPAERGVELRNNDIYPAGPSIDTSTRVVKNYQITGEQAVRAVVKVEFSYEYDSATKLVKRDANGVPIRHPRAVIESFNIIPND